METKIYLISGKMGSGKSTFARMLSNNLRGEYWINAMIRFADPLKQVTELMTGIKREDTTDKDEGNFNYVQNDYAQEQKGIVTRFNDGVGDLKLRAVMQLIGTDCIRENLDMQAWIKMTEDKIYQLQSMFDSCKRLNIIIPDCRFPNEVDLGERMNIETERIRIERPMAETHEVKIEHESETALDDYNVWTYMVYNEANLRYLEDCATSIASGGILSHL